MRHSRARFQGASIMEMASSDSNMPHVRRAAEQPIATSGNWLTAPPTPRWAELAQLILDQAEAAIVVCDEQTRIVRANPATRELCGRDPIGQLFETVLPLQWSPAEPEKQSAEPFSIKPALHGHDVRGLCVLERVGERPLDIFISTSPYRGPGEEILCIVATLTNVTTRQRAQARLQVQYEVSQILAESNSLGEAAPRILKGVGEGLGWDFDAIWQVEADGTYVRPLETWHRRDGTNLQSFAEVTCAQKFARGEGLPGRVWESGKPTWIGDVRSDSNFPRASAAAAHELRSAFAFPFVLGGRVVGVMEAMTHQQLEPDTDLFSLMQVLGTQIGLFLLRQQGVLEVARLAAIVKDSFDSILAKDLDGIILDWNPAAERLYQYSRAEIVGKPVTTLFPPERLAEFDYIMERVRRGSGVEHYDTERVRKDGTRVQVSITVSPVHDATGTIIAASTISHDVTQRKASEKTQRFLVEATERLSESLDYETTLQKLTQVAVPFLADWCAVHILREDAMMERLAVADRDPARLERVQQRPAAYPFTSGSKRLAAYVLETGRTDFAEEVTAQLLKEAARDEAHLDFLRSLGLDSYISVPLRARGRTLGAVTFALSGSSRRYTRDDLELAQELSRRAALAVDNARLYSASRRAQARLELIAEASIGLTTELDFQARIERLIHLVVPRLADWCSVNLREPDGSLNLVAMTHRVPEKMELATEWARRFPISPKARFGSPQVIRTGKSEFVPRVPTGLPGDIAQRTEAEVDLVRRLGIRSYMIVPLAVGEQVLGAMSFIRTESHTAFTEADLAAAEEIARRAAVAFENAELYHQEQRARHQAEENAGRLQSLQDLAASLSAAVTREQVAAIVVERGVAVLGAQAGGMVLLTPDQQELELVRSVGYTPQVLEHWRRFPITASAPVAVATRTGEVVLLESREARRERYPNLAQGPILTDIQAWAAIPLMVEKRVLGAMGMGFEQPRQFAEPDVAFMRALGQMAAQAMERATLFDLEQRARQAAERAARRSHWLVSTSQVLSGSLNYKATLKQVADLAVPEVADWCLVYIDEPLGEIQLLAVANTQPEQEHYAYELNRHYPLTRDLPYGVPNVIRTGKSELIPVITDEMLVAVAQDDEALRILRSFGYQSLMMVPLIARGRTLGALSLVSTKSGRHFGTEDVEFAELLAGRAAIAIDNARLYEETQQLNAELELRVRERTYQLTEAVDQLNAEVRERTRAEELTRGLLRIGERLNGSLDLDTVQDVLAQEAHEIVGARISFVALRTAQGLTMHRYYDGSAFKPLEFTWAPGVGIAGYVLERKTAYLTNDLMNEPRRTSEFTFNDQVRSLVCAPIIDIRGEVLGFLEVLDKQGGGDLTEPDLEQVMALTPLASIAIQNALAYEKIVLTEVELQRAHKLQRALTARLQTIREEERTDIARELHDEMGQSLTALKFDLAALISRLPKATARQALRERAQTISDDVDRIIKMVRRLTAQLRPGMLDDLGLTAAIEWYCAEFQERTGLKCNLRMPSADLDLTPVEATALYRIFQETLTNVARHASASKVDVWVESAADGVTLRVEDDGRGIDVPSVQGARSLGLLGMRERAESIGATFEIESESGKGTRVIVNLPRGS